jgi:3-phosphoinositide dependent protein kinase-1
VATARAQSHARSRSRNTSINARLSPRDFDFGEELGEGSYSSVSTLSAHFHPKIDPAVNQVVRGIHLATGKEYAVKILDKGHLFRKQKLPVALAEKNTLVRLASVQHGANGHPGIVRLHFTFHDEYSLCEQTRYVFSSMF